MSSSVQSEALRKEVAPEAQESLIERAVRIGHKTRQPAALRNGYKIRAWNYPWEKFLTRGVIVLRLQNRSRSLAIGGFECPGAGLGTMHFGRPIPSNIYPVGLSPVLAKTKVYTVKY